MKIMTTLFYIFLMLCVGFVAYQYISKIQLEKEYLRKSIEVQKLQLKLLEKKL